MSKICELHDKAMDIMNEAIALENSGHAREAQEKFMAACRLESESAALVEKKPENEPSRGMLFLGAASLAFRAKDFFSAERLACEGLTGFPTAKVRRELRILYDEIKHEILSLETANILSDSEAEIRFWDGDSVGYGSMQAIHLNKKITAINQLLSRTVQRLNHIPFELHPRHHNIPQYDVDIHWAQAASFGIKISLKQRAGTQIQLNGPNAADVMRDFIENIRRINNGDNAIHEAITDENYLKHFVSCAKDLFPDGKHIRKITIIEKGKSFYLTKKSGEFNQVYSSLLEIDRQEEICFSGLLSVSDGIKGVLKLSRDGERSPIKILVKEGLADYAKNHFGDMVTVRCRQTEKGYELIDMSSES